MLFVIVGGALAAYATCSGILLYFPTLLHEKKQHAFSCTHISHRGGSGERPENTLSAFEHAVGNCGTDMLELDCQLTADGHVVVAHDPDLRRCGRPDQLFSLTKYADLPQLSSALTLDFVADGVFDASQCPDRQIPLLRDVFERFPDTPINLDVKQGSSQLVAAASQLINQYGRQRHTVWGSFSHHVVARCHATNPRVPLFCSIRSVAWIVVAAYTGLLPFLPIQEGFFEVPMPLAFGGSSVGRKRRVGLWVVDKLLMRAFIVNHLRRRGVQVYVWVLNTEDSYRRAFQLGVTGVMTDYPSLLQKFLRDNPQYMAPTKHS